MNETGADLLGLFGGTFDPPHIGHLRLAIEAREALGLTKVNFIPAGRPVLREEPCGAAEHRLAMVVRGVADVPGLGVDATEVRNALVNPGPSYTVETLERQRQLHGPQRPLVLLLGADAFARLESWHRWRELFDLAHIAVATRPGHELVAIPVNGKDALCVPATPLRGQETALQRELAARHGQATDLCGAPAGRIVPFAITALEISATVIRQRLARGLSVRYLVHEAVLDYIVFHQIYRTPHGH